MFYNLVHTGTSFLSKIVGSVCPLCHEQAENSGFCKDCQFDFYHEKSVCPVCAELSPRAQLCGRCQKKQPAYDALFISVELNEILLNVIHAYKYQRNMQLSGALARLMLSHPPLFLPEEVDYIVSVPISEQHLWHRGFNQSHLLAKAIGKYYNKAILIESTFSRIERPHQATLKYKERQKNVKNIFKFIGKQNLEHKKILIIDDIATTGATLNELASCIKKQGAHTVYAWALAKRTHQNNH